MNNLPVVVERTYNASAERVWKALTNVHEMRKWYFEIPEFKAEPGFRFTFPGGTEDKIYIHHCEVTEVVDRKKIVYSWRYEDEPGESLVTFELNEEGNKTRLKVTHSGLHTFSRGNPDLSRENFEKGWSHILDISLDDFLKKP